MDEQRGDAAKRNKARQATHHRLRAWTSPAQDHSIAHLQERLSPYPGVSPLSTTRLVPRDARVPGFYKIYDVPIIGPHAASRSLAQDLAIDGLEENPDSELLEVTRSPAHPTIKSLSAITLVLGSSRVPRVYKAQELPIVGRQSAVGPLSAQEVPIDGLQEPRSIDFRKPPTPQFHRLPICGPYPAVRPLDPCSGKLIARSPQTFRSHLNAPSDVPLRFPPPSPSFRPFNSLAYDTILEIFSYLDPGTSTCFGLTCKLLYASHTRIHGKASMFYRIELGGARITYLFELLDPWMGVSNRSWRKTVTEFRQIVSYNAIRNGLYENTVLAHQLTAAYKRKLQGKSYWHMTFRLIRMVTRDRADGTLCFDSDRQHHRYELFDVADKRTISGADLLTDVLCHYCDTVWGFVVSYAKLWDFRGRPVTSKIKWLLGTFWEIFLLIFKVLAVLLIAFAQCFLLKPLDLLIRCCFEICGSS